MAYQINLEQFEGPFDLLLHLIKKNQIDIYDIPISVITGEYLQAIKQWQKMDMEIASEFIIMAARLMEIKSRMLLSGNQEDYSEGDSEQEELIAQLLEYQTYKKIAEYLKEREEKNQGAICKEPEYFPELETNKEIEIDPAILGSLLTKMTALYRDDHQYKKYSGEILKDSFTVEEKVELLLKKLKKDQNRSIVFSELLNKGFPEEVIVAFQAVLTCYKNELIRVTQMELFGEIRMYHL